MMGYSELDPVINKWMAALGSTLFKEWAGQPARFFYTHGDPPFEVFQISIDLPENGRTAVYATAVDTNDGTDDDMDQSWTGQAGEIDAMLASAIALINVWKARPRVKPDPPSPW